MACAMVAYALPVDVWQPSDMSDDQEPTEELDPNAFGDADDEDAIDADDESEAE